MILVKDSRLLVGVGHGEMVEIITLQPSGKRAMSAAEFLRGHAIKPGSHFGAETA
jgi:methionyl-tRNA formyltransferase